MKNTERKQQLIAEGALHRTGVILARSALQEQARPATLVKRSLPSMVAATVSAWMGGGAGKLLNNRGTTLAMSALPLLWKRLRSKDKKSTAAVPAQQPVAESISQPIPQSASQPKSDASIVHPSASTSPRPTASFSTPRVHARTSHSSRHGMSKAAKLTVAAAAAGVTYFYLRGRNKP